MLCLVGGIYPEFVRVRTVQGCADQVHPDLVSCAHHVGWNIYGCSVGFGYLDERDEYDLLARVRSVRDSDVELHPYPAVCTPADKVARI